MTNATEQPAFRPFNPEGELRVYVRNLPHWRQPGATYFVTFRQDDSIPQGVLAEWQDVRERWKGTQPNAGNRPQIVDLGILIQRIAAAKLRSTSSHTTRPKHRTICKSLDIL